MTQFEFNSVVVSILVAFALAEILASWGRLIEYRERVRAPILYVIATAWLFSYLIAHWLGLWAYRNLPFESFVQSFILFFPTIIGALAAYVFTPALSGEGKIDMEAHYFSIAPWGYTLMGIFVGFSGVTDLLVPGEEPAPLTVFLAAAALLIGLGQIRNRLVHFAALSFLWAAWSIALFTIPI